MTNTSAVYARIDTNLKERTEEILSRLGISPSYLQKKNAGKERRAHAPV